MQNSYEFFTNNSTGDAMSSLYKLLMSIKTIIRRTSREIIPHCLTCVAMLGSFIILHWSLFLIMIGYLVSHTLVCVFTYKKISALQARSVNAFTKNIANLTDVIMNFSSVLLFSRKKYELKRAKRLQNTECLRMEISNVFVERVKFIRLLLCFTFCGAGLFADLFYLYANNRIGLADIIYTISGNNTKWKLTDGVYDVTWFDKEPLYDNERVLGLAEMMNAYGVVHCDEECIKKCVDAMKTEDFFNLSTPKSEFAEKFLEKCAF